ncbi:oxidoreductase [Brachybacterium ginsengisoli]|uniref:Oxidoreductase n=1 Tax=Brachybacterium ginsengisoli TaxID=1331682 RepID=A0A291H139_9MICO|nr:Gfo/Idh/MocA family oxidoreductase [Brachybacterium ginsengisoli]ATG56198.1 oxidoreductase [Brachybacterium ginsengisoli]
MLSVGIIGTGNISRAHVNAYLGFPEEVRIVALADTAAGKAEAARAEHGLDEARAYDDPAAMLADEQLDLVSIATPPSTHCPLTVAALEAGVNVIVEKPMAPSLEECDRMLEAQERSGKLLSVVAQNRFRDDMARLKAVLDSERIGRVTHARIASEWWRGLSYYDLWWRGTWESEGGGPTLNHAIHHLDLTLWLLGRPQAVAAMMTNAAHHNAEVEDLSVAILQYERGLAELTSSVVHHGEQQQIVIQGEHARISQPWEVAAETARPNGFPAEGGNAELAAELEALAADHQPLARTGHAGQLGDVIAALAEGRPPLIDGEAGKRAIELVTAIYAAAIERRTIDLPIAPEDPWYRSGTLVERAPHFFEKTASVSSQDGDIDLGPSSR